VTSPPNSEPTEPTRPVRPPDQLMVNMFATTTAVVVVAPLPGVMAEQVEVRLKGDRLSIRASRASDSDHDYLLHEWVAGTLTRELEIPQGAGWPLTASMRDGQLTITLGRVTVALDDDTLVITPTGERESGGKVSPEYIDLRAADQPEQNPTAPRDTMQG
jgi:HSP20 family molecular chaperone IbpA